MRYSIHELEKMLKQAYSEVEQERRNMDECNASAPAQQQATIGGCEVRPATRYESTLGRLRETLYRTSVENDKAQRAIELLEKHPEFMDYIELAQSGLIY